MNNGKNKNVLLNQFKYDIKTGIILEWKQYMPLIIFAVLFCFHYLHKINNYSMITPMRLPNFGDYLIAFFKGKEYFEVLSIKDTFTLPAVWIIVNLYLTIIVNIYPMKDFKERGYQTLLRVEKKSYWWLSKCFCVIFQVLFYYGIIYFILFIFSCCTGGISLKPNDKISIYISEIFIENIDISHLVLITTAAPVIVSITLSLLELTLSFLFNSITGILLIITYLIVSTYWCKDFLLGNYSMLYRSDLIIGSKGVNGVDGILLCLVLSGMSMVAGYLIFKNIELMNKKGED